MALGQGLNCDFHQYIPLEGLKAAVVAGELQVTWQGERDQQLRAVFAVVKSQPLVRELAVRKGSGGWLVLARNLSPEFEVVSGRRRLSEQQAAPLRALGITLTPDVIEREKWNAFWDAPLEVPGAPRHQSRLAPHGARKSAGPRPFMTWKLPGENRWRAPGNHLSRPLDGHLCGRLALHGLSRNQPAAPGGHRQDRRALRGLQIQCRLEGFFH